MHSHVTGQVWRGAAPYMKGTDKHDVLSWRLDLAKLNPKCHLNYSIIFREIVSIEKLHVWFSLRNWYYVDCCG